MKRKISYIIIAVAVALAFDQLSSPDLNALTGKPVITRPKKVDLTEWHQYVNEQQRDSLLSKKPYKNPFVTREHVQNNIRVDVPPSVLRGYSLTGIVAKRAIIISDKSGSTLVLKVGDTLKGATLQSVKGTVATFKDSGGEFTLSLK